MPTRTARARSPRASGNRRSSCFVRLPRTPSAKIVTFARMSTPGFERRLALPVLSDAAIASANADHLLALEQDLAARETEEQIDAFRFDEAGQPLREAIQRDDIVAVIAERRRGQRQTQSAAPAQEVDLVLASPVPRAARPARRNPERARRATRDPARRPTACARRPRAPSRSPRSTAAPRPTLSAAAPARSAADRPAGPAPTIRMSTSRVSRDIRLVVSSVVVVVE